MNMKNFKMSFILGVAGISFSGHALEQKFLEGVVSDIQRRSELKRTDKISENEFQYLLKRQEQIIAIRHNNCISLKMRRMRLSETKADEVCSKQANRSIKKIHEKVNAGSLDRMSVGYMVGLVEHVVNSGTYNE